MSRRVTCKATAAALCLLCVLCVLAPAMPLAAPSCKDISVSGLGFGTYNPLSPSPLDAAGTIFYSCPPPARPFITLSKGSSGSYAPRRLRGPVETLAYNVYLDAARTIVWGDGTGGTQSLNARAGNNRSVPLYGRIPAGQDVAAGAYSDSIVVTFNF